MAILRNILWAISCVVERYEDDGAIIVAQFRPLEHIRKESRSRSLYSTEPLPRSVEANRVLVLTARMMQSDWPSRRHRTSLAAVDRLSIEVERVALLERLTQEGASSYTVFSSRHSAGKLLEHGIGLPHTLSARAYSDMPDTVHGRKIERTGGSRSLLGSRWAHVFLGRTFS